MTDLYCIHEKVFGQRGNSLLTEEEIHRFDIERLKRVVPSYTLYAFAELVCNNAREVCRAISDPRNPRNKWRPIEQYDGKVISLCERIKKGVGVFNDAYVNYLAHLQTVNSKDVYDAVALTNDAVTEATEDKVSVLSKTIDKELMDERPIDPYLFSAVNRLLFISSLFIKYRKTFNELLGTQAVEVFRSLKIDNLIRELINELRMQDRNGKTFYYLYEPSEVRIWLSLGGRKRYHGIEVEKTHIIDIRERYGSEEIDRKTFDLVREVFRIENINKFCAAGNGGKSPGFGTFLKSRYFFGCMETYEQYSFTSLMLYGDIQTASCRLKDICRMFPNEDILVCYSNDKEHATFNGIYPNIHEASVECGDSERDILLSLEGNKSFRPGRQKLHITRRGNIYYRLSSFEEFMNEMLKHKAS